MLLSAPLFAHACKGYVIGFKGLNESFNSVSFQKYTNHLGYCGKSFSWYQNKEALQNTIVNRTAYGGAYGTGANAQNPYSMKVGKGQEDIRWLL